MAEDEGATGKKRRYVDFKRRKEARPHMSSWLLRVQTQERELSVVLSIKTHIGFKRPNHIAVCFHARMLKCKSIGGIFNSTS